MDFHSYVSNTDKASNEKIITEEDFFVGKDSNITLIIPRGLEVIVKNIVVMGTLDIRQSNQNENLGKSSLKASNIIEIGHLSIDSEIKLSCDNCYLINSIEKCKRVLQNILVDWFVNQRRHAREMGFKSILVEPHRGSY